LIDFRSARQYGPGFKFLEGDGVERCAALGPVPIEEDPELMQSQRAAQAGALIGDRIAGPGKCAGNRQPAAISKQSFGPGIGEQPALEILRLDESGGV
jgi:hypothetical protein